MSTTLAAPKKRRPRIYRAEKPLPLTITPQREIVLKLIAQYGMLDVYQLMKVRGICLSMATRALTDLKHGGLGRRFFIRPCRDNHTFVLDHGGFEYLDGLGCAPEGRFRPDEAANKQPSFIRHAHDCISLQILADLYNLEHPDAIRKVLSDKELHRIPMKVTVNKETVAVIPDGLTDLDLGDNSEHVVLWEIDRGTTNIKAWKTKLLGYLEALKGEYKSLGIGSIQAIAVVVTSGDRFTIERRVLNILSYTEEVLSSNKKLGVGFRVTAANLDEIPPEQLFTQAIWFQPYRRPNSLRPALTDYQPVTLLGG